MAELLKILAVALVTVLAHVIVRQTRPEIATIISIAGGIVIIILAVNALSSVINSFYHIFNSTGVDTSLLVPLIKIIAMAQVMQLIYFINH